MNRHSLITKTRVFFSEKKNRRKAYSVIFGVFVIVLLLPNSPISRILEASGYSITVDNNVDADSNIDNDQNEGTDGGTSYQDARTLDGTDQIIREENYIEGAGGDYGVKGKLATTPEGGTLVDGRHYSNQYGHGEMTNAQQTTFGVSTFKDSTGNWKSIDDWNPELRNRTYLNAENNSVVRYTADGGEFRAIFNKKNNTLMGDGWNFTQRPNRAFIYDWDGQSKSYSKDARSPDNITYKGSDTLRFENVFTDTDIYFGYNGTDLKELVRVKIDEGDMPDDPYPDNRTYFVIETAILNHSGLKFVDDSGEVGDTRDISGVLNVKNSYTDEIVAYLPLGMAWALFADEQNHTMPVKWRMEKIGDEWRIFAAVNYTLFTHNARTGDVYIDPTWTIGNAGDSWGECTFYQTLENVTTGYAQLYPYNTTGNITSPVKPANKNWIYIEYQGDNQGKTVDIYWNSSRDNGVADPYEVNVVYLGASPSTAYAFPIQEKYGSWQFVLETNDPNVSPIIYNVTIENAPPDSDDFAKYKQIEINYAKVNGSTDFDDFPALVYLSSDSDLNAICQGDGDDISFANSTAWLDFDLEQFNETGNGELVAWVRIPTLSATANTTVTMYYGNAYVGAQENPSGTWSNNYMGVWHLGESSGNAQDSTSYDTTGILSGGVTQGVTGQVNGAYEFDGTDDTINMGDTGDLDVGTEDFSIELWVKRNRTGLDESLIYKRNSTLGYNLFFNDADNETWAGIRDSDDAGWEWIDSDVFVTPDSTWHHIAITFDRSSNAQFYTDNVVSSAVDITANSGSLDNNVDFAISSVLAPFQGAIDEVRILSTLLSADWIGTEYNNQYSPSTFYDVTSEQDTGIVTLYAENNTGGTTIQWLNFTVDSDGANRMGIVFVGFNNDNEETPTVYFDGVSMTNFDTIVDSDDAHVSMWYLNSTPSGSALEVAVDFGATILKDATAWAGVFNNVDLSNAFGTQQTYSGDPPSAGDHEVTLEVESWTDSYTIAMIESEYLDNTDLWIAQSPASTIYYYAVGTDDTQATLASGVGITSTYTFNFTSNSTTDSVHTAALGVSIRATDVSGIVDVMVYVDSVTNNQDPDDIGDYSDWTKMQAVDGDTNLLNESRVGETVPVPEFGSGFVSETASGSSVTINKPIGTVSGNLLILIVSTDGIGGTIGTPTSGTGAAWSVMLAQVDYADISIASWYKIANSTEPSDYTSSWSGNEDAVGASLRFTGFDPAAPFDVNATNSGADATVFPAVTTTRDNTFILRFAGMDDDDDEEPITGTPSGHTFLWGRETTSTTGEHTQLACYTSKASLGTVAAATWNHESTEDWASFTFAIQPTEASPSGDYLFDREFSMSSIDNDSTYTNAELVIKTGTTTNETLIVHIWNGTASAWEFVVNITDSDDSTWLNTSILDYWGSETLYFRFNSSIYDGTDTYRNHWYIDAVAIHYWNITGDYRLEWEHQVQSIDTDKDVYVLTIYGFSSDSEDINIEMWNPSNSSWSIALSLVINTTETWYNQTIGSVFVNTSTETITWRYHGSVETDDSSITYLRIDYAGVRAYNMSIYGLPDTHNSLVFSADSSYHALGDSPLSFQVEAGASYDIQISGVDVTKTPVTDGYVYVNSVDESGSSIQLTTGWQNFLTSQSAGNTTFNLYLWVNTNWSLGDPAIANGTYSYTVNVTIVGN